MAATVVSGTFLAGVLGTAGAVILGAETVGAETAGAETAGALGAAGGAMGAWTLGVGAIDVAAADGDLAATWLGGAGTLGLAGTAVERVVLAEEAGIFGAFAVLAGSVAAAGAFAATLGAAARFFGGVAIKREVNLPPVDEADLLARSDWAGFAIAALRAGGTARWLFGACSGG